MPIVTPGKRVSPRLQKSKVFGGAAGGKKDGYAELLITPLVDMFIIIVIFLLQNFSATGEILFMAKEITLPDAQFGKELARAPVVQISGEAVMLEGEPIAFVQDLAKDEYWNVPELEEKLRDLKKRHEALHPDDPEGFKGELNIQAHSEVEFRTLKRVMYSANQAGYLALNFAVMQKGEQS